MMCLALAPVPSAECNSLIYYAIPKTVCQNGFPKTVSQKRFPKTAFLDKLSMKKMYPEDVSLQSQQRKIITVSYFRPNDNPIKQQCLSTPPGGKKTLVLRFVCSYRMVAWLIVCRPTDRLIGYLQLGGGQGGQESLGHKIRLFPN